MKHAIFCAIGLATAFNLTVSAQVNLNITFSTTGTDILMSTGGDEMRVDPQSSTSLTLEPGIPQLATINNLFFYVGDSSPAGFFSIDRFMTISTVTEKLPQNGFVYGSFYYDWAAISSSPTIKFNLPEGTVNVTALGLNTEGFGTGGHNNYSMQAEFQFTPVPEPAGFARLSTIGMLGLLIWRARK